MQQRDEHSGGRSHLGTGQVAEPVDLRKLQEICFRAFCAAINYNIQQNNFPGQLTINFQGQDCRIMECNTEGTCLADVPGGEPQSLALKPDDCTRLMAVCGNVLQYSVT